MSHSLRDDVSSHTSSRARHRAHSILGNWQLTRPRISQTTTDSGSISSGITAPGSSQPNSAHPLPVEDLIQDLTSHVPSLQTARMLASALPNCSPLPSHKRIIPLLLKFCKQDCPPQFQAIGFEIICAYWENPEAPREDISTADRMTFFTFFEEKSVAWAPDLWEARYKALKALTRQGRDVNGVELDFLRWCTSWIEEAFNGWFLSARQASSPDHPFTSPTSERSEIAERDHCIDVLASFLGNCLRENPQLKDITQSKLLDFYVSMVNRAIDAAPPPTRPVAPTPRADPSSRHRSHIRTFSSTTSDLGGLTSPSRQSFFDRAPDALKLKPPQEKAIQLYLDALHDQLKILYPASLNDIMPVLFRSMSYACYPMQRLQVHDRSNQYKDTTEAKIMDVVHTLLGGPYTPAVYRLIKSALAAPIPPDTPAIDPPRSNSSPNAKGLSGRDRSPSLIVLAAIQRSHGAFRVLRSLVRRSLSTRMARAYLARQSATNYSYSGAPAGLGMDADLEQELLARAWASSPAGNPSGPVGWDAGTLGKSMRDGVRGWVQFKAAEHTQAIVVVGNGMEPSGVTTMRERIEGGRERVLEEAASLLRDVFSELDERDEGSGRGKATLDPEEAVAVGGTLDELAKWLTVVNSTNESSFTLPLAHPSSAPSESLQIIATLLSRDHTAGLCPPLSTILWGISGHLSDADTAKIPAAMMAQRELEPVTVSWIDNWRKLLLGASPTSDGFICPDEKPRTVAALLSALKDVYNDVKDIGAYRRPLAKVLWDYCRATHGGESCQNTAAHTRIEDRPYNPMTRTLWDLLGEELVLRQLEFVESIDDPVSAQEAEKDVNDGIELLCAVAVERDPLEDEEDEAENDLADLGDMFASNAHSMPPASATFTPHVSPTFSRRQTDMSGSTQSPQENDVRSGGLLSLLSSFAGRAPPSTPSVTTPSTEGTQRPSPSPSPPKTFRPVFTRPMGAISALARVFSSLVFTPSSLEPRNIQLALQIFKIFCTLAMPIDRTLNHPAPILVDRTDISARARLMCIRVLMRLRADREHHLYLINIGSDTHNHVSILSALIHRGAIETTLPGRVQSEPDSPIYPTSPETSRVRVNNNPFERLGRRITRGRGSQPQPSPSTTSRSRSRLGGGVPPPSPPHKQRIPLWAVREVPGFSLEDADRPSEKLTSYDPDVPEDEVLPISDYLELVRNILQHEKDWEILSYVLCHLPVQLANKHLFCGPICRGEIGAVVDFLCTSLFQGEFATKIERWPTGLKPRDAQSLAYHTLSVFISYKRYFDGNQRNLLVEVFQLGLNGQPATIKCCMNALSLAAFELQTSMTKCMTRILERLSEIMSNADMAVHILDFLSIVGSLKPLQANFTEIDYRMVFGVALKYLQLHSSSEPSPTTSFALAQHVRVLSYYIVYVWFLAIKVPNRAHHVSYITKQLLLANEGRPEYDDAAEICFDWLARYTYGSADPRPANSTLSDIIMNPTHQTTSSEQPVEKAWMIGNSILTTRVLPKNGWVEIVSRRPSGLTKFLLHVENVPLVGPGDVEPDLFSIPAVRMMDRSDSEAVNPELSEADVEESPVEIPPQPPSPREEENPPPVPNSTTGYVWSRTAPSQRRKEVTIDPSFFALQISPHTSPYFYRDVARIKAKPEQIQKFFVTLDRKPVIDTHKVGVLYVAPGQTKEEDILANTHGSPFYTRFLEGLGRLINLRGQVDVYAGGLSPDEDGEYAYAWWDDIGQILFHTATMMPNAAHDPHGTLKKRHIGNDYVKIIWNDSGFPYRFDTLTTAFQFVNIVIEPHSLGAMAAFSNSAHENEYFRVVVQRAERMADFSPVGAFKIISAENLPALVRQLCLLADWYSSVFDSTKMDTIKMEYKTNWVQRLESIRRFRQNTAFPGSGDVNGITHDMDSGRDFTVAF